MGVVGVASTSRSGRRRSVRRAITRVVHCDGGNPPLPLLAERWARQVGPDDEAGRAAFEDDLRLAEQQLSAYRSALHDRIGQATGELIARYRESPDLCLTALPLERGIGVTRPRG